MNKFIVILIIALVGIAFYLVYVYVIKKIADDSLYPSDMIEEIYLEPHDTKSTVVVVRPLLESAFYLGGAQIERNNDTIIIELVRCRIRSSCTTDVVAQQHLNKEGLYELHIDSIDKPIVVNYSDKIQSEIDLLDLNPNEN